MNQPKEVEYLFKLDCKDALPVIHVKKRTYELEGEEKRIQFEVEEGSVTLQEISTDQLFEYRVKQIPGLILKKGGKYFYAPIDKNLSHLRGELLNHKCTYCKNLICNDVLCRKVADRFIEFYKYPNQKNIRLSKRIEKYDFIPLGYEIINKKDGVFVVGKCNQFKSGF